MTELTVKGITPDIIYHRFSPDGWSEAAVAVKTQGLGFTLFNMILNIINYG